MRFSVLIPFLLSVLPSIDSAPVVVTPKPVVPDKLYDDKRYIVPVEVPYKIRLPSKDTIELGLKDAFKTFEDQKIAVGKAPEAKPIGEEGLHATFAEKSYLWSKKGNNNNIILAIHHEQPFELDFHLKSLPPGPPGPKPVPSPATVAPVPGPPATTQAPGPVPVAVPAPAP